MYSSPEYGLYIVDSVEDLETLPKDINSSVVYVIGDGTGGSVFVLNSESEWVEV